MDITIIGTGHMGKALTTRAVAGGHRVITGTVGLEGLAAVLSDLGSGKPTQAKVLVDPER